GDVDLDDLLAIRTNYLQSVTDRIEGDLTGDLFVDSKDFREWKTAFLLGGGNLTSADLSFLSVPEPAAFCLLLVGSLAAATRKRR
ncbi:MAG: PEP-CTERM sorting domain-containing protein, partial [Planctomycetales bacterium]|nr:PEP-CTERM sorting domain-containing protein [Planctomycetales bacterium]